MQFCRNANSASECNAGLPPVPILRQLSGGDEVDCSSRAGKRASSHAVRVRNLALRRAGVSLKASLFE
jgi:hypothetical protein